VANRLARLPDYLEGAVDLHVHSSPDVDPRRFDDLDLAREAARARMGAILLKSHQTSTVERAYLVSRVVWGISVYGGIVLNETVGGLNRAAVHVALQLGAKQVWMPTRSAANHRKHEGRSGGITILDRFGLLLPEVADIVDLVSEARCILGTGHLSPEEVIVLADYLHRKGGAALLVTHPEWSATYYSIELQKKLAAHGNVMFERCFVSTTHRCGYTPFATIEKAIADIGVSTTVLSTDLGQPDTPAPVDGLRMYAERLRVTGFSPDDLRQMMQTNPHSLLARSAGPEIKAERGTPE
jgi:hypothetical protein